MFSYVWGMQMNYIYTRINVDFGKLERTIHLLGNMPFQSDNNRQQLENEHNDYAIEHKRTERKKTFA